MAMQKRIQVLDHGYVEYVDHLGSDASVIEAARMSTGRGFEGWDRDSRLLSYLYRHRHSTPFEMCELAIEVKAPIMVFREWHRHRTQSINEFSARYSVMPDEHYVPKEDRFSPKISNNVQESSETSGMVTEDFQDMVRAEQEAVYEFYSDMISSGVPKEVARINTPVSRYSKMRAKTDLRNWLGFLNLRMRENAQWEIRQYANAVAEIVKSLWPKTYALFEEHDLLGCSISRSELQALRSVIKKNGLADSLSSEASSLSESELREFLQKFNL